MTEPATSSAGGYLAVKWLAPFIGGTLAIVLGFIFMPPKSVGEFMKRLAVTAICSALLGPLTLSYALASQPDLFNHGAGMLVKIGYPENLALNVLLAPFYLAGGLPGWWLLGAVFRWLEKRRDKDIGELAGDAVRDVKEVIKEVKS